MSLLAIPLILFVWLMPLAITALVNFLYEPATELKRGVGKMINRGVLVFYKYRYRTTMVHKDVCPLCHESNMRCRVTINPITGVRSHKSLVAMSRFKRARFAR